MDEKYLDDPILMLKEIEAYLMFRIFFPGKEPPMIPGDEMRSMRMDILECLRRYDHRKEIEECLTPI